MVTRPGPEPSPHRGQPLLAIALVLCIWAAGRLVGWPGPWQEAAPAPPPAYRAAPGTFAARVAGMPAEESRAASSRRPGAARLFLQAPLASRTRGWPGEPVTAPLLPLARAAFAAEPPPGIPAAAPFPSAPPQARAGLPGRWSADGWLLLRDEGGVPLSSGRPSYGRSQIGAVLRYRLLPESPHRPQLHLRASSALSGQREQEAAAGISARPLPAAPLRLAAELRLTETSEREELRAAVYAVTELPPVTLPLGLQAEAYAQAGYVTGRYATGFIDGQGRVERDLAKAAGADLRGGVGLWGGAQKGSERLDLGPTASASFRLGRMGGRLAADYRFRVAGNAQPASGPALTLSAGF